MRFARRSIAKTGLGLLLGAAIATGGTGALAQDATPEAGDATTDVGRPAHIHSGTCEELGDVVAPLNNLTTAEGGVTGEGQDDADGDDGAAGGIPAEYSYTLVNLSLDDILAAEHAINVHESVDEIDNYIACGNLEGNVDANGSLVVGLRELNDSGFSGIAFLSPNAADPASTDVSVFIAQGLHGDDAGAMDDTEDATDDTTGDDATDDTTGDDAGDDAADDTAGDDTAGDTAGDDTTGDDTTDEDEDS